jgi:hypothetical protein
VRARARAHAVPLFRAFLSGRRHPCRTPRVVSSRLLSRRLCRDVAMSFAGETIAIGSIDDTSVVVRMADTTTKRSAFLSIDRSLARSLARACIECSILASRDSLCARFHLRARLKVATTKITLSRFATFPRERYCPAKRPIQICNASFSSVMARVF